MNVLTRGNVGNMFQFDGEEISYQTEEEVEFLGRSAKKYTFESNNAYGYNLYYHEEITIDDETGACLKFVSQGRAGDGFTGSTRNKVSFEMTEFAYGEDDPTVREFLDAVIDQIDVFEWDAEFIEQAGLTAVDAPVAELYYSEWDHRSSRDAEAPEWNVQYKFYSLEQENDFAAMRDFAQSFFAAGATLTEEGEADTLENMYWEDEEDGSLGFTGYTADYEVQIYCDYMKRVADKYWRIDVSIISKNA